MGCGKSKNEIPGETMESSDTIPERKIILVGDSSVGKSAIIHSFIMSNYSK